MRLQVQPKRNTWGTTLVTDLYNLFLIDVSFCFVLFFVLYCWGHWKAIEPTS